MQDSFHQQYVSSRQGNYRGGQIIRQSWGWLSLTQTLKKLPETKKNKDLSKTTQKMFTRVTCSFSNRFSGLPLDFGVNKTNEDPHWTRWQGTPGTELILPVYVNYLFAFEARPPFAIQRVGHAKLPLIPLLSAALAAFVFLVVKPVW